ncbi:ribosomal protein S18-alanine N-acetyltransferase [Vibrio sp. SCSIO 43136]|uniref:ribosomal protein S18-alanine N-acetyltransferase n=1 Tax=Vibrio sp. SCSIO 43136 TaxID=2819101 RepID=UPI002075C9CF|nr:ribosomal protein S18-alanine N-acetyltransferase [Vibrio sp. SCSIO 43136]USD64762.1 ribosomal protein S18-alanine N-acetyltransferase [Vibrio sp. SCSIO 43136]
MAKLTPITAQALDQIWLIEQAAHTHPWSESMIRDLDSRGACHHMLVEDEQVIGYFYAQNIVGEITLLNIVIDPKFQSKGYGRQLLSEFLNVSEQHGCESAWLEVRESNIAAYNLYQSEGFNEVDRRRDYYPTATGREDAVVMSYLFLSFS